MEVNQMIANSIECGSHDHLIGFVVPYLHCDSHPTEWNLNAINKNIPVALNAPTFYALRIFAKLHIARHCEFSMQNPNEIFAPTKINSTFQ